MLVLEARSIYKKYGHVQALSGADFAIEPGEVVSLIGDNGAGKSTLVKILSGAERPDEGELYLNGEPVEFSSPEQARRCGIETVYQDLALAPDLGACENAYIGRELVRPGMLGRLGFLDKATMRAEAQDAFVSLGTDVRDLNVPIAGLSGGQRQSVAICRAVMWASKVIVMDEPTAALGVRQTKRVLELIRRVAGRKISVILISHNMPEVLEVSDRVQVLRLGRSVTQFASSTADVAQLVGAMTGSLDARPPLRGQS